MFMMFVNFEMGAFPQRYGEVDERIAPPCSPKLIPLEFYLLGYV